MVFLKKVNCLSLAAFYGEFEKKTAHLGLMIWGDPQAAAWNILAMRAVGLLNAYPPHLLCDTVRCLVVWT